MPQSRTLNINTAASLLCQLFLLNADYRVEHMGCIETVRESIKPAVVDVLKVKGLPTSAVTVATVTQPNLLPTYPDEFVLLEDLLKTQTFQQESKEVVSLMVKPFSASKSFSD